MGPAHKNINCTASREALELSDDMMNLMAEGITTDEIRIGGVVVVLIFVMTPYLIWRMLYGERVVLHEPDEEDSAQHESVKSEL